MNENKGSITGKRNRMLNLKIKKAKLQLEQIYLEEKNQRLAETKNKKISDMSGELLEEIIPKIITETEMMVNSDNVEMTNEEDTIGFDPLITINKTPEMISSEISYSDFNNEKNNLNISKDINSENKQLELNATNSSKGVDIDINYSENYNTISFKEIENPMPIIPDSNLENTNKYPTELDQISLDEKNQRLEEITPKIMTEKVVNSINGEITTNKTAEMISSEIPYSDFNNEKKDLNSENKQLELNTNNSSKGIDITINYSENYNTIPIEEEEKTIPAIPNSDLENNSKYPTKLGQEEVNPKSNINYEYFKNLDTDSLKEKLETELDLFDEELYRINEKLKTIKYDNKTDYSRETLNKTKKELEEIEQKIKEIKRVLTNIIEKYDPSDLNKKYTETTILGLKDYLEEIKENDDAEFSNIKKDIAIIEANYKLVDAEIIENEKKVEKNDNEVKKIKEDYDYLEKIYKDTQNLMNKCDQINTELKEKVKNMSTIKEEVEEKIKYNSHFLENIFLIYTLLTMDKKNPMAKLQANMIMYCLIANMVDSMIPRRESRIKLKVTYEDYRKNIQENIKNVISIREVLELSLNEIDKLKEYFEKDLKDYLDDYPEYKELYKDILEIEKGIKKQLEELKLSEDLAKENEKENEEKIVTLNSLQKQL